MTLVLMSMVIGIGVSESVFVLVLFVSVGKFLLSMVLFFRCLLLVGGKRSYGVRACKDNILSSLHLSEDFNVCLEDVYRVVERFDERCVPLTISQIIRLKMLHHKIWCYPVLMVNDMSDEEVRVWRELHGQ